MSVSILQCRFCALPFQTLGGQVCHTCQDRINAHFCVIRDYLYDHEDCRDIDVLSEATGVPRKEILYLIEEKRLITSQPMQGAFVCCICKKDIMFGDLCSDCKASLAMSIKATDEQGRQPAAQKDVPVKSEPRSGGKWRSSR